MQKQEHWEAVYQKKNFEEVSWFQEIPTTSIAFFESLKLPKSAKIIDIGGGESRFVDYLLEMGYENVSVLDISATAIEKKKAGLGGKANLVTWIVSDVVDFRPTEQYDCWHDRAAFHFLTQKEDVDQYVQTISQHIKPEGTLIIGTFSNNGPEKCSGLPVQQYSENSLTARVGAHFTKIKCDFVDHTTPFSTVQNFIFCQFQKKK